MCVQKKNFLLHVAQLYRGSFTSDYREAEDAVSGAKKVLWSSNLICYSLWWSNHVPAPSIVA